MEFDYFYGKQSELFSFYRIPKVLFTDKRYWNVSTDAKLLYGILLDRMNLSARNGWFDEAGRVYIIFTIEEIMSSLGCADQKAQKMLGELEKKCGLIERKRQGLGKPNLIYVKNFSTSHVDTRFLNSENHDSGKVKNTSQEQWNSLGNNTDKNNTEFNNTDPFLSSEETGLEMEVKGDYQKYYDYFQEKLQIPWLLEKYPYDKQLVEDIFEIILETVLSKRQYIRIASDDKPVEIVRSRLMKLDSSYIDFAITCFKENTTKIRNIKQYLLATVFNAPVTMDGYYDALVRHDMANGRV